MDVLKAMTRRQDVDGRAVARVSAALARALHPLENDVVRDFLLNDGAAANLSVLTAPELVSRCAIVKCEVSVSGGPCDSQRSMECLLFPCGVCDGQSLGVVFEREDRRYLPPNDAAIPGSLAERFANSCSIGRYCLQESGELLLVLGELDRDPDMTRVQRMTRNFAGDGRGDSGDNCVYKICWYGPFGRLGRQMPMRDATRGRLHAILDGDRFRRGHYADSLIFGTVWQASGSHRVGCVDCAARTERQPTPWKVATEPASAQPDAACTCYETLLPASANLDSSLRPLRGIWSGISETTSRVPGWTGPALVLTQRITILFELDSSLTLCGQLLSLAIEKSMSHAPVNLLRQDLPLLAASTEALPPVSPPVVDADGRVEADDDLATLVFAGPHAPLGDSFPLVPSCVTLCESSAAAVTTSTAASHVAAAQCTSDVRSLPVGQLDTCTVQERRLERVRKNRESAARSNLRRKERNDKLKAELRTVRSRVSELAVTEKHLRDENFDLRRQLLQLRAARFAAYGEHRVTPLM
jgi:hypothetical protein